MDKFGLSASKESSNKLQQQLIFWHSIRQQKPKNLFLI